MTVYLEHDPLPLVVDVVDGSASQSVHLLSPGDVTDMDSHQRKHSPAALTVPRPPALLSRRRQRRQLPDVDAESGGNDVIPRHTGSVQFELDDVRQTESLFRRNCAYRR